LLATNEKAKAWNRSDEGRVFPLDIDLSDEKFHAPEVLLADEDLKPEILAGIAAPLMTKGKGIEAPAEAVRVAHELLMAATHYIGTLPKQKGGTDTLADELEQGFCCVSFDEIIRTNQKEPRQLPLLPPVQQKRNEGQLTATALKTAALKFLKNAAANHPNISEAQWNREELQETAIVQLGRCCKLGIGCQTTYQDWQRQPDKAITDCQENSEITLQTVCQLRWERFQRFWQKQRQRASNR
jgi:hypothetical protein